jgi:hypothetical protein
MKSLNTPLLFPFFIILFSSCSNLQVKYIKKSQNDTIRKESKIFVERKWAKKIIFSGDDSNNKSKNRKEKEILDKFFRHSITSKLSINKLQTSLSKEDSDYIIKGSIIKLDRGSAQKRLWVGFGHGKSSMETQIIIYKKENNKLEVLKQFTVYVDTGIRQGIFSIDSFIPFHIHQTTNEILKNLTN